MSSYGKRRYEGANLVTLHKRARSVPLGIAVKAVATKSGYVKRNQAFVPGKMRIGGFYKKSDTELKFLDTALSHQPDTTGEIPGTGGQINLIPQGDTESMRNGRKCTIKSIRVRGGIINADNAASREAFVMYLVLDTQCNGQPAGVTDVLTSTNFGAALPNLANVERFKILRQWKINIGATAGVAAAFGNAAAFFDVYKKCNIPLVFDNTATTGAIGTIRSNNVFLMCGAIVGDDVFTITGTTRIRFTDV